MAMGKAVVSTSIGAEGLPVTHGENVMLADSAVEFAAAVVSLLHERSKRERLERAARDYVVQHCSWESSTKVFAEICQAVHEQGKS
jgi:glycosyltransferase involved in cell wall biosynthesis